MNMKIVKKIVAWFLILLPIELTAVIATIQIGVIALVVVAAVILTLFLMIVGMFMLFK